MRNQFVVPQFLDVEPRIIGPITIRQFIEVLAVVLVDFFIWKVFLNVFLVLGLAIPWTIIGIIFAFIKINGQPFHIILLNIIQTVRRPNKRVWDKTIADADLRVLMVKENVAPVIIRAKKAPLEGSRLSELTLVVNTGGVYGGEE